MVADVLVVFQVPPSSKLYCAVNPAMGGNAGTVIAVLQVLATTGAAGAVGKTTKLAVPIHDPAVVVNVAVKHPAVVGENTPVVGSIVPPPVTDHVPNEVPVLVKVTVFPLAHELAAVIVSPICIVTV